jgi:predicted nucleotidyltransferase
MNNSIIKRVQAMASEKFPEAEIRLFGSRARGDAKDDSDWDFLILLPASIRGFDRHKEIMDDFYEIELETGEILAPFIYNKEDWETKYIATPLYENILQDGISLQ